jgi:glutamate carboxypeptidase
MLTRPPFQTVVTALLAGALAAAPLAAQAGRPGEVLSATERAIVAAVDARNDEALALLERVVNINSGTMNFAGVRQVGDLLRREFDALGFRTTWVDGAPFQRAGHLVAEHDGAGDRVLLIGHLDTVFEPTSPFQRFERLSDSTARGPGIIDMKGGDVIILHALKALKAAGVLDRMSITVVMTGDEEKAGSPQAAARAVLVDAARRSRYAIGFEDGDGDPKTAVVARRGASSWTLHSTGTPAHSSQIFRDDVGPGAIFEAARVLQQFREQLGHQQFLTFNPGVALGGTDVRLDSTRTDGAASGKTNVVARTMDVSGDIRTISPEQYESAKVAMRRIVGRHLPRTTSTITFVDGYPPLAPTPGNSALLARYDTVSRALGLGPVRPVDPSKAGAADVSFTAAFIKSAIDGVGLAGSDDHTEKETADLRMLAPLTRRAAVLLYRLLAAEGKPRA